MDDMILASYMAFEDGDEQASGTIPLQVTEVNGDRIEVAFDDREERMFLTFNLSELVAAAMKEGR